MYDENLNPLAYQLPRSKQYGAVNVVTDPVPVVVVHPHLPAPTDTDGCVLAINIQPPPPVFISHHTCAAAPLGALTQYRPSVVVPVSCLIARAEAPAFTALEPSPVPAPIGTAIANVILEIALMLHFH